MQGATLDPNLSSKFPAQGVHLSKAKVQNIDEKRQLPDRVQWVHPHDSGHQRAQGGPQVRQLRVLSKDQNENGFPVAEMLEFIWQTSTDTFSLPTTAWTRRKLL